MYINNYIICSCHLVCKKYIVHIQGRNVNKNLCFTKQFVPKKYFWPNICRRFYCALIIGDIFCNDNNESTTNPESNWVEWIVNMSYRCFYPHRNTCLFPFQSLEQLVVASDAFYLWVAYSYL